MILRKFSSRFSILLLLILALFGCNRYAGFEDIGHGLFKRLDQIGDCSPALKDAKHFIMEVQYESRSRNETGYSFQLHHHNIQTEKKKEGEDSLGYGIRKELLSMNCGDAITIIAPFDQFDNTYLSAYADASMFDPDETMTLKLKLLHTFSDKEYAAYLLSASQQNELSESEAIELLLMNDLESDYEKHGDCFIQRMQPGVGDSIAPGAEVTLIYNTYLLDGKQLDQTTELQFTYGRPGQVVDGLQYGLSFLRMGDEAMIYLPSYLAFGEKGSTGKVVPPKTPIFFKVKITDVKK
jgi:FKBP-type peptidyl-prolyl cis-trans isomerase